MTVDSDKLQSARRVALTLGIFFDGSGNCAANTRYMRALCAREKRDFNAPDAERQLAQLLLKDKDISGGAATSYLGDYSNIYWLSQLYRSRHATDGDVLQRAIYIDGIGTQGGAQDNVTGLGFGTGELGVIAKTNAAVALLASAIGAALSLLDGAFVLDSVQFDIFGFSRGAAAARHFANRIQAEDSAIIAAIASATAGSHYAGAPVGKTRFIGLFDTVAAIGTVENGFDPHSADNGQLQLLLRSGVAQRVFHLTAQHECRYNFALNSVSPAWPEMLLPGAHSDIGGGYLPQVLEDYFMTRPLVETLPYSTPGEQSRVYRQAMAALSVMENAPAVAPLIRTQAVTPEVWEDGFVPNDRYGQMQKRNFSAQTLRHRVVRQQWSTVALRVMMDAAREAGVEFDDDARPLPDVLIALCERARAMGRVVRSGGIPETFSVEEIDTIFREYIHCSAHWNPVRRNDAGEIQGGASASETLGFMNRPDEGWVRTVYDMDGRKR